MRHKKLYVNTGLGVAVAALVVGSYLTVHSSGGNTAAAATRTALVQRGTVSATVSGSGNVTSALNKSVSFQDCSGTLTAIYVKAGQKVITGQKLGRVTTTDAQTAVDSANLTYKQAVTSRDNSVGSAQTQVDDAQDSYDTDVSNADDSVDKAQDSVDDAQDTRDTAKATLKTAEKGTDQQAITAAQSAYDKAGSALTQAKESLTSAKKSRKQTKSKDNQSIDSAQTSLSQTEDKYSQQSVAVTTARTALDTAKANLLKCTLTAPSSGTITEVDGTIGDTPGSSSSSTTSSTTGTTSTSDTSSSSSSSSSFITLVDLSKLEIDTDFSEADIGSVKVGQQASVLFSALTSTAHPSGTTVVGKVTAVDATSTVTSSVVDYGVTISLVKPPATLRLGQTGTVTITTATKANALEISTTAITTTGTRKTVTVQNGKTTQIVAVTTGVAGDSTTQITSGLTAGQTVVIPTTTTSTSTTSNTGGFPGGNSGGLGVGGR